MTTFRAGNGNDAGADARNLYARELFAGTNRLPCEWFLGTGGVDAYLAGGADGTPVPAERWQQR